MRGAFWAGWCSSLVLGLAAARASAAEVEWRGPAACPDAEELRFRIERAIAMPLSHAAPLHFRIEAERSAEGYGARMDVDAGPREPTRRRVLTAPDCAQLADLVAVTAAIALGASESDEALAPADAAPPAPPAPVIVAAPASASSAPPWSPELALWFLADAGSLPHAGTGLALGVGVGHGRFRLRALGTWLFEQHVALQVAEAVGAGARLALVTGALSACAAPFGANGRGWVVDGCAGWELGRLSGEGEGVLRPRSSAALWSAPRLDVGARWAFGTTGLELGVLLTLAVPLAREDFVLGDLGSVHRAALPVGRAALGLNWRLE
ncbi:MAG TPA: hypothetical protein VMG12_07175 [Polyangiaceae bacterium]|nr:hypothetical protein [Polyangiaceae bacterium]